MSWPRLTTCARCGEPVLQARHRGAGRPATLEPNEILPAGRCGSCRGTGKERVRLNLLNASRDARSAEVGAYAERLMTTATPVNCRGCDGTGVSGEPLPTGGYALTARGVVRRLGPGELAATGEAVHRPHRCAEHARRSAAA